VWNVLLSRFYYRARLKTGQSFYSIDNYLAPIFAGRLTSRLPSKEARGQNNGHRVKKVGDYPGSGSLAEMTGSPGDQASQVPEVWIDQTQEDSGKQEIASAENNPIHDRPPHADVSERHTEAWKAQQEREESQGENTLDFIFHTKIFFQEGLLILQRRTGREMVGIGIVSNISSTVNIIARRANRANIARYVIWPR
jgi:hypothetical protein